MCFTLFCYYFKELHRYLLIAYLSDGYILIKVGRCYLFTFYKSKCFRLYIRNSLQENGKHDTLYLIYLDLLNMKRVKSEFKVEKSTLEWNPRSPIHHVGHFWALESVAKKIGICSALLNFAQYCSNLLSFTQIHSAFAEYFSSQTLILSSAPPVLSRSQLVVARGKIDLWKVQILTAASLITWVVGIPTYTYKKSFQCVKTKPPFIIAQ